MEGFVNNNAFSPFENGLKYSNRFSNYGVNNIGREPEQNRTKTIQNQPSQQPQTLLGAQFGNFNPVFDPSVITDNLPENFDDAVNTVVTPNQNKHQRLKTAIAIGVSTLIIGGLSLIFTKGKISKTLTDSLGKIVEKATDKIEKINQKQSISTREGRYLAFLQGANRVAFMARGALFNITPLKDVLFSKFVRKTCKLDKPCDSITNAFRHLSFATVKSSYKKAGKNIDTMLNLFESTNRKIASNAGTETNLIPTVSLSEKLDSNLSKIKSAFAESFGESALEKRNGELISRFDGLDRKTYDNIYGKIKTFVSDVDEWTTFVPERLVAHDKAMIMENLASKKRVITNNPSDNFNAVSDIIKKLENLISPNSKDSINAVKNLRKLASEYVGLSGDNEFVLRQQLIRQMNSQLKDVSRATTDSLYGKLQSKKIISLLRQFGKILNTDKKGLIEEQLSIYRKLLPEEEYKNIKKVAEKAIKSLNDAVYREGFEYTDKARDLAVGSALTDVAIGMALPIGTTSVAMASADTKQKKRSVGLKYGLPLLAGITTSTVCTMRLIAGGKALMLGAAVSILGNELFERLDNYLIKRDEKKRGKEVV